MDPVISAPSDRAISVGAHADVSAIDGRSRVRLEVALRGIDRAAGRRSAMRIGVVIDARRTLNDDEQARVRDVINALDRARGTRDRVAIHAAGVRGGELVPLGQMRYGEVEVGLRRLFDSRSENDRFVSLGSAIEQVSNEVQTEDEVALVLVLSPTASTSEAELERAIRESANRGVTLSAVGIGHSASSAGLNALALWGQGRRRVVHSQVEASEVVRAELEAASRLVARALRLRVKLAPGVELVDVIGSHPLSREQTRRTRAAERAIDRQMETRLGIRADRDEDDTGVRILIPSFYAGDAHTVIFDLIVSRPGPVADIDVKFKDLVRLGNGTTSAAVTLPAGPPRRGTREYAVLANAIGQRMSAELSSAAESLERDSYRLASTQLQNCASTIARLRESIPALARDRILNAQQELCQRYAGASDNAHEHALLQESIQYASRRFLLRPQTTEDSPH